MGNRDIRGTKSPHEKYFYNQAVANLGQSDPTVKQKKQLQDTTDYLPDPVETLNNESIAKRPTPFWDTLLEYLKSHLGEIIFFVLFSTTFLLIKELYDKYSAINKDLGKIEGKLESLEKRNTEIYEDFKEIYRILVRKK
ncbi:hypothetical protein EHQ68_06210 [Leptospira congkakensis]|uniref:hypothetical protein n=1 Tax=Leptospira congkakensis TaxID=2484932 RepID=UPI0010917F42|nr:hypothetical protein [Leptospira congkakensis]TGL90003.1 hypothetical protein EHQ68_06210 [Leptospira congkakensis]